MFWKHVACLTVLLASAATARAHFLEDQIFIVDASRDRILHVAPTNFFWRPILDQADGLNGATALTFNAEVDMIFANKGADNVRVIYGSSLNGDPIADSLDGIDNPSGPGSLAVDGYGWIYVASASNQNIIKMRPDYLVSWVLADSSDGLVNPTGMAFLSTGDMLVANNGSGGQVLMIDAAGTTSVFDTIPGEEAYCVVVRPNQDMYVGCDSGNVYRYAGGMAGNRSLLGSYGERPAMAFNVAGSILYLVNRGAGRLQTIDPDSGTSTVVVSSAGWDPVSIGVSGSHMPAGSFRGLGATTVKGAGNYRPEMHGDGNPRLGGTIRLDMHDFVGWTQGFIWAGIAQSAIPFGAGVLYIDPTSWYTIMPVWLPGNPGAPAEGNLETLTFSIPNDGLLLRTEWYFQGMAVDAAAASGVSISHCLKMVIGD